MTTKHTVSWIIGILQLRSQPSLLENPVKGIFLRIHTRPSGFETIEYNQSAVILGCFCRNGHYTQLLLRNL